MASGMPCHYSLRDALGKMLTSLADLPPADDPKEIIRNNLCCPIHSFHLCLSFGVGFVNSMHHVVFNLGQYVREL